MTTTLAIPEENVCIRELLLALIFDLAGDRNYQRKFIGTNRRLHRFFWRISRNERYRHFVEELLFDSNGTYPQCDQLDELLQELLLSGVLAGSGLKPQHYDVSLSGHPLAAEFKQGLEPKMDEQYGEILGMFKKELGVPVLLDI